jgi:hypothetical protein
VICESAVLISVRRLRSSLERVVGGSEATRRRPGRRGDRGERQLGMFRSSMAWIVAAAAVRLAAPSCETAGGHSEADEVQFGPAVVEALVPAPFAHRERKAVRNTDSGIIEIDRHRHPSRSCSGKPMIVSIVQALKASRCDLEVTRRRPISAGGYGSAPGIEHRRSQVPVFERLPDRLFGSSLGVC